MRLYRITAENRRYMETTQAANDIFACPVTIIHASDQTGKKLLILEFVTDDPNFYQLIEAFGYWVKKHNVCDCRATCGDVWAGEAVKIGDMVAA